LAGEVMTLEKARRRGFGLWRANASRILNCELFNSRIIGANHRTLGGHSQVCCGGKRFTVDGDCHWLKDAKWQGKTKRDNATKGFYSS